MLFVNKKIILTVVALAMMDASETADYPAGFREWLHVKSAIITGAHPAARTEAGIHHIYANAKAVEGYRTGHFRDGSIVVFELVELDDKPGLLLEGARRRVDVMVKDAGRFAATGGWGFSRFSGDSQTGGTITDAAKACFECHSSQKEHDFVFSKIR